MEIPFFHEFSSEIDRHCIATIQSNFSPNIIFGDVKERKLADIPDIDLYVCGFPCQSFSIAGKREGFQDPRGTVFWECLRVIRAKKPIIFILENVKGLLSINGGETFRTILTKLERLRVYNVYWKVLNTADYGIPQSRKRVFIVGILKKNEKCKFEWPKPIPCRSLENFVDWKDIATHTISLRQQNQLQMANRQAFFIDLNFNFHTYPNAHNVCPTLTTHTQLFNCKIHRMMNLNEFLMLQGFPLDFICTKSASKMKSLIGNSMSVNVLTCLFKSIFRTIS
jgi:DNA (cytosine-5)-methyltransferase 1